MVYLNQNYKRASLSLFLVQYGIQPALSVKLENVGAGEIGGGQHLMEYLMWSVVSTKHSKMIIALISISMFTG